MVLTLDLQSSAPHVDSYVKEMLSYVFVLALLNYSKHIGKYICVLTLGFTNSFQLVDNRAENI